ncbi:hypothetical protein K438DRAFT_1884444, partial [Mycena galopus ATCC 62051]
MIQYGGSSLGAPYQDTAASGSHGSIEPGATHTVVDPVSIMRDGMMQSMTANDSDLSAYAAYSSNITANNDATANRGVESDISSLPARSPWPPINQFPPPARSSGTTYPSPSPSLRRPHLRIQGTNPPLHAYLPDLVLLQGVVPLMMLHPPL